MSIVAPPEASRTFRVMERLNARQSGGAGGGTSWEALQRLDDAWTRLRTMPTGTAAGPPPAFVREHLNQPLGASAQFDVLVCGGTIGIFIACALALRGLKVAVLERAPELRGREQDWNISRKELAELVASGVLTAGEVEEAIGIEFNPMRCGFAADEGGAGARAEAVEVWTDDVLNVGVRPDALIRFARARFEASGGVVREGTALGSLDVFSDGVRAPLFARRGAPAETVSARLVLDAMGNASPILAQQRHGVKPDGVCLVVGTLASGYVPKRNLHGDIIATSTPLTFGGERNASPMQIFWEAFPASSGPSDRTTYAAPRAPRVERRPRLAGAPLGALRDRPLMGAARLPALACIGPGTCSRTSTRSLRGRRCSSCSSDIGSSCLSIKALSSTL